MQGEFGPGLPARLRAMGIDPPRVVSVIRRGWWAGPLVVRVGTTTVVAIRNSEASLVLIERD